MLTDEQRSGRPTTFTAERLSAPERKIRFVYVPKHSSWMNQVEIWFSAAVRRVLKRGNFPSREALRQRLLDFIDYFQPHHGQAVSLDLHRTTAQDMSS